MRTNNQDEIYEDIKTEYRQGGFLPNNYKRSEYDPFVEKMINESLSIDQQIEDANQKLIQLTSNLFN
jgi:hypothetical protein